MCFKISPSYTILRNFYRQIFPFICMDYKILKSLGVSYYLESMHFPVFLAFYQNLKKTCHLQNSPIISILEI